MRQNVASRHCQSRLRLTAVCSSNVFACWRRDTFRTLIQKVLPRDSVCFLMVI
jgi:hypothetical protein